MDVEQVRNTVMAVVILGLNGELLGPQRVATTIRRGMEQYHLPGTLGAAQAIGDVSMCERETTKGRAQNVKRHIRVC